MSVTISARNQVRPRFTVSPHQHRNTTTQPNQTLQALFAIGFAGIFRGQHRRTEHRSTLGQRGAQKAPRKVATAIRLSPEVTEFFKAGGRGWQTRIDEALREYVKTHSPG